MDLALLDNQGNCLSLIQDVELMLHMTSIDGGHTYLSLTPDLRQQLIKSFNEAFEQIAFKAIIENKDPQPVETTAVKPNLLKFKPR